MRKLRKTTNPACQKSDQADFTDRTNVCEQVFMRNENHEQDVGEENDRDARVHGDQIVDVPGGDAEDSDDINRAIQDVEKTDEVEIRCKDGDDRVMREFKWYEINDKEAENVVLEFQVRHVVTRKQLPLFHIFP